MASKKRGSRNPCFPYAFTVLERNTSVNAQTYCNFIGEKVIPLRRNLTIMHDNARPYTANATKEYFQQNNIIHLKQPPYSPDFNLLDRYVFRNMEFERRDIEFRSKAEVEQFLDNFLGNKMTRYKLSRELERLRGHLQTVIDIDGDYI